MHTMLVLGLLVVHAPALVGKTIKSLNTKAVCLLVWYLPMCHEAVFCLWCKEIVLEWDSGFANSQEIIFVYFAIWLLAINIYGIC